MYDRITITINGKTYSYVVSTELAIKIKNTVEDMIPTFTLKK